MYSFYIILCYIVIQSANLTQYFYNINQYLQKQCIFLYTIDVSN